MIEAISTTSDSGKRLGLDFLSGFTGLSERKADLYVKKKNAVSKISGFV